MHYCSSGNYLHYVMWNDIFCLYQLNVLSALTVSVLHEFIHWMTPSCRLPSILLHIILEWKFMNGKHLPPQYGKSICIILIQVLTEQDVQVSVSLKMYLSICTVTIKHTCNDKMVLQNLEHSGPFQQRYC